jgi:hypothetical protein
VESQVRGVYINSSVPVLTFFVFLLGDFRELDDIVRHRGEMITEDCLDPLDPWPSYVIVRNEGEKPASSVPENLLHGRKLTADVPGILHLDGRFT